jgi:hypothetical protein
MTLSYDTFTLSSLETAELHAARDRLRAAIEQLVRDLEAIEGELERRGSKDQRARSAR